MQVTVFAVGVGSNLQEEELDTIASTPKCSNVYQLAAFSDITAFTNQIMNGACKGETQSQRLSKAGLTLHRWACPVSAANLWHSLPAHLTTEPSLTIFRHSYPDLIIGLLLWT